MSTFYYPSVPPVVGGGTPVPITFVGSDSQQHGSTASLTMVLPTTQVDDFAIMLGMVDDDVEELSISSATGWTEERVDVIGLAGRDRTTYIWHKFLTASENNPVIDVNGNEEHSCSLHVFRNVDTTTPFDTAIEIVTGQNFYRPTNAAITTNTDSCCLMLMHAATEDDIASAGLPTTPAGLVLGEAVVGGSNDHRQQITAYKLDVGVAGEYTPSAWTHTGSPSNVTDYTLYTIALRAKTE